MTAIKIGLRLGLYLFFVVNNLEIQASQLSGKAMKAASTINHSKKNKSSSNRIIGGDRARPNEFPYQLALEVDGRINCGAALIHPKWALTAAHCFVPGMSPDRVLVIGGEHRITVDEGHEVERNVEEIFSHEEYVGEPTFSHDIALLKLKKPFRRNKYINVIAMPSSESYVPTGDATVSGWGVLQYGSEEQGSDRLMKVTVPIVDHDVCVNAFKPDPFTSNQICAGFLGEGGRDSCQGDSGGPLAVKEGGKPLLVGVVSVGIECAQSEYPGIYTSVAKYRSWIDSTMN